MTDDDNTPHDPQSEQPTPTGAVAAVKQLTEWANNPRHFGYVGMGHDMKVVLAAYDRQRKALEEIADPILFMRKRLKPDELLNGMAAAQLADSPCFLRDIARAALEDTK